MNRQFSVEVFLTDGKLITDRVLVNAIATVVNDINITSQDVETSLTWTPAGSAERLNSALISFELTDAALIREVYKLQESKIPLSVDINLLNTRGSKVFTVQLVDALIHEFSLPKLDNSFNLQARANASGNVKIPALTVLFNYGFALCMGADSTVDTSLLRG